MAEGVPARIGRIRPKVRVRVFSHTEAVAWLARALYPNAYREEFWIDTDASVIAEARSREAMTIEREKAEAYAAQVYAAWTLAGVGMHEGAP